MTDPDFGQTEGIAITAVDNTNGAWQYSLDAGATWVGIAPVGESQALLLASTALVRFVPNSNFSGLVSNGLTFRAWDGSAGTSGSLFDTTTNGGTTAFSTVEASSSILVNDAPVLIGANPLTTIAENPTSNPGTLVSTLIAGQASDVNGNPIGVAVTAVNNANGDWQYSVDGGADWTSFGSPSARTAVLLTADANTLVRFVPNSNFSGLVATGLTFQAWDQTSGTAGGTADATIKGGTTAFSVGSFSAAIRVDKSPTIAGAAAGQTTGDNASIQPFSGVTVGDTNAAGEMLTATVTIGTPANGQFTSASLTGWTVVTAGSVYQITGDAAQVTSAGCVGVRAHDSSSGRRQFRDHRLHDRRRQRHQCSGEQCYHDRDRHRDQRRPHAQRRQY